MKLRNKAGGLSIITFCSCPENVGRVVRVVRFYGLVEYTCGAMPAWIIEATDIISAQSGKRFSGLGAIADAWMTPISDPDVELEVVVQEAMPV